MSSVKIKWNIQCAKYIDMILIYLYDLLYTTKISYIIWYWITLAQLLQFLTYWWHGILSLTQTCSSSFDIPRIGIRVPSIAPTTFGKSATFIKFVLTRTRSVELDGKWMFCRLLFRASITSLNIRLKDEWEIPCKSAAFDWISLRKDS